LGIYVVLLPSGSSAGAPRCVVEIALLVTPRWRNSFNQPSPESGAGRLSGHWNSAIPGYFGTWNLREMLGRAAI